MAYQTLLLPLSLLLLLVPSSSQTINSDIVIIGAGTSGCILAGRLCQAFPGKTIHLLERGLPRSQNSEFLATSPRQLYNSWSDRTMTEAYDSEPDAGINNRRTTVLTAGTLGGTSTIGGFQWTMPLDGTVEKWNIQGLNTQSSRTYFNRAFNKMGFGPPGNPLIYADEYVQAAINAGYPLNTNNINPPSTYVWQNRVPINSAGRQINTCQAYVDPVRNGACSSNLKIVQGVTASKLVFGTKNGQRAIVGVETLSTTTGFGKQTFMASSQVLLTSGPYNSPKLLQLSGIGSSSTLQAAGVTQQLNLPVGEATICRASLAVSSTYTGVPDEPANNLNLVNSPQERAKWDAGNGGILATPVVAANGRNGTSGYFNSNLVPFSPGPPTVNTACYHNTNTKGFVRIRNSNPFTTPAVKYNLLGSQSDVNLMKKCLTDASDIHRNFPPFFQMRFTDPTNGVITDQWIREKANTGGHFVGGCPVGPVLTSNLKLKGLEGIRVIDASSLSAMPMSAGPVSSVEMLAEYMSDVLANEL